MTAPTAWTGRNHAGTDLGALIAAQQITTDRLMGSVEVLQNVIVKLSQRIEQLERERSPETA